MGRRVTKTKTKKPVEQCVGTFEFDEHVVANLAGHVQINKDLTNLKERLDSCDTRITHNYNIEQKNAKADTQTLAQHARELMLLDTKFNDLRERITKLENKNATDKPCAHTPVKLNLDAAQIEWLKLCGPSKPEQDKTATSADDYQRKTDENIKYVRDNITHAMRHMVGWSINRQYGNSLLCRITFNQKIDINVHFTDRTMSITFTRRDYQRVEEVFSDFGKGSTTLASIMMFYMLRK